MTKLVTAACVAVSILAAPLAIPQEPTSPTFDWNAVPGR
jgi:hypothetical protein